MQTINKKDIPQELIVDIEKVSNLGFGIAKVDGYVIFVEGACPKDKVKIRLGKKNKNYANAKVVEVIEPSPYRIEPFCPMQKFVALVSYNLWIMIINLKSKNKL